MNALNNNERREIQSELDCALAELAMFVTEQTGEADADPPF